MEKREKWPSLEILEDSLSGWRKRKRNRSRRGMNFEEITEVHVSGFWILTNHWSFCDVRLWDISNGFVAIMSDPSETLCWNSWQLIEILRDHIERESNRKFYSLSLAKILSTSPSLMESCEILSFPTMARHEMRLWLTEAGRGGGGREGRIEQIVTTAPHVSEPCCIRRDLSAPDLRELDTWKLEIEVELDPTIADR